MTHLPRDYAVGEIYHIINRGVNREKIFSKPQDYSRFILGLELFNCENSVNIWQTLFRDGARARTVLAQRLAEVRKAKREPIVELMAFVLMPNHYHLIIREIIDGGISLFMRKMGGYSLYYNKQQKRLGHLFESRYKAIRQISDYQAANLFAYVHTNPVELIEPDWKDEFRVKNLDRAIKFLNQYQWSSYQEYLGTGRYSYVIDRTFFLDYLGGRNGCRRNVEEWVKFKAESIVGTELADID